MEVCIIVGVLVVSTIVLVVLLSEHDNNDNSGPGAQAQHKLDCLEIALTGKYNRD